jgi:hypothetical protein
MFWLKAKSYCSFILLEMQLIYGSTVRNYKKINFCVLNKWLQNNKIRLLRPLFCSNFEYVSSCFYATNMRRISIFHGCFSEKNVTRIYLNAISAPKTFFMEMTGGFFCILTAAIKRSKNLQTIN